MKLYNTLTRSKDQFEPITPGTVKLYTCGLTVYSQPHIGNWVSYIYWDILQRTLEAEGYSVERIQNITDVGHLVSDDDDGEDKMEKGARAEGVTAWEVAEKYSAIADHEAFELLGLKKPKLIRATDCIDQQITFVKELEARGFTYKIENEGIYFDTSKLTDYGKLARLDLDGLQEGARVHVAGKRNPTDFALWKFSPSGVKRDMEWESPWGTGFPGWHLECSAIAKTYLGEEIDIHTGGIDHIPVHHTNEIAQTEAITNKPFARFWIHNNHIKVNGGKMSKSKGTIYTLQDISKKGFDIAAFKLMILSKHYRTEGNFSWEILEAAQNRLNNWRTQAALTWQIDADTKNVETATANMRTALADDLGTPQAIAAIDAYFDQTGQELTAPSKTILEAIDTLLGIDVNVQELPDEHEAILQQRAQARADKDWATSDQLRDQLLASGVVVNDHATLGQLWSYK